MIIGNYIIDWEYCRVPLKKDKLSDVTLCRIYKVSKDKPTRKNAEFVSLGYSIRNPKDRFIKDVARRVSMNDALIQSAFTKEQRKEMFKKYDNVRSSGNSGKVAA